MTHPDHDYGELIAADTVRFTRLLPGPIERIWGWLTESDQRARWLAAGRMPTQAGESFNLYFDHNSLTPASVPTPARFQQMDGGCQTRHSIIEFQPPHRLAFTWDEGQDGHSAVTFELSEQGDRVQLVLTHTRLAPDSLANVAGGWHTHLGIFTDKLGDIEPTPFWAVFEDIEAEYKTRLG